MAWENNDSLFRRIVESSPEAIVFSDREAVGESLDIIVPEKLRERHWEGYFRVMKTGATKYGKDLLAVPGIRKDGSLVSLEFSVALIRDGDGALMGISAVMRDVTARWQKEKEMKERLAALEAQAKGSGNPP